MSGEPAWLVGLADQRMAELKHHMPHAAPHGVDILITTLTEPRSFETAERWDRTCDGCGQYIPPCQKLYGGKVMRTLHGVDVLISYACCQQCGGEEAARADERAAG